MRLGRAQEAVKNPVAARIAYQKAIQIRPDLVEAQVALAQLEIQAGRKPEALKLAQQIQKQQPKLAAGYLLEGDLLAADKQYEPALAAFDRAHKLEPSGAAIVRQHQALAGAGRPEEGEKRLVTWLASHPQEANARFYLADNLLKRSKFKEAAEHYLVLNAANPNNIVILNNLAWSFFEAKDNRALPFAEQALKLQPDNPTILDTYGWILVNDGNPTKGLISLKKALSKAPDVADIHWHVIYALNASGDKAHARQELKTLLSRNVSFSAEAQARQLYKQLTATP